MDAKEKHMKIYKREVFDCYLQNILEVEQRLSKGWEIESTVSYGSPEGPRVKFLLRKEVSPQKEEDFDTEVLLAEIKRLRGFLEDRGYNIGYYEGALKELEELEKPKKLTLAQTVAQYYGIKLHEPFDLIGAEDKRLEQGPFRMKTDLTIYDSKKRVRPGYCDTYFEMVLYGAYKIRPITDSKDQ